MSEADPAIKSAGASEWTLGPIFDADAHIDPPHDMWKSYLPSHLKDRAPYIEHAEEGDFIVFEGNRRPFMMINNQAGREGKNFKMQGRLADQRKVWEPSQRLADMDADGMDAALLFGGGPLGTTDNELYVASYEAYQNWVLDFCSAAPDRLFPVGYVPMRDIDETCEHVARLAKKGFRAINLPAFPQNKNAWETSSGIKNLKEGQVSALTGDPKGALQYSDPAFDKLWKTVCDHNVIITFHLGARVPRFGQKEYFLADMPMSKLAMAEPIGIFIYNAIFDRFPDLRIGSMESGVGWFAWFAEYNDRTWEKQRFWTECPIKNPPSYYMDTNVFGSFIQDRTGILCRNLPGGKNIMWSSDYPHSETTFPRSREIILRDFAGVPDDDIKDIINNNARNLLGLS
ncbi:amidohydrolase family protein [Novosphingobium sp. M1R2S20]|uniref:Amidohydrolase family protein n=1 Tax=Novosphingobium rhizovicinum TaxID=3228928 RepID=A0ABV3R838_9SPHN